jgi:hypothetical protein
MEPSVVVGISLATSANLPPVDVSADVRTLGLVTLVVEDHLELPAACPHLLVN